MKFDSKLTFEDHVSGIVSCVSQRIGILGFGETYICGHFCSTSFLISICSPNP